MFWSGETLRDRLPELITLEDGTAASENNIDCAAYPLRIGSEVFITPNYESPEIRNHTKQALEENQHFNIPYGQFAFFLTEEIVHVPEDAIAFISFKAKYKFQGLVNVSGFHVDPGYKGRLIFSVYNAGPKSITLRRGQKFFLIWYASLDKKSNYIKKAEGFNEIGVDLINSINGEVYNPIALKDRITDLRDEIKDVENNVKKWVLGGLIAALSFILLTFSGRLLWDLHKNNKIEEKVHMKIEKEIQTQSKDQIKKLVEQEMRNLKPKPNGLPLKD